MKKIFLTKGASTIVDDELYEELKSKKWYLHSQGYAVRGIYNPKTKKNDFQMLHNYIIKPPLGLWVDHINRNKLDNRKRNLRLCTISQNNLNGKWKKGKSRYWGVSFKNDGRRTKPWRAYLKVNGKQISLGVYETPEEAAKQYNQKAKEFFGEFARLNRILRT